MGARTGSTAARPTGIEPHGIDTIPEEDRTGSPWDIVKILVGGDLALSLVVIGWLPITFGLSWWSAATSLLVGTAAGALVLAPIAMLGMRTGTNNAVSSGAHFGVVGRIGGSVLALASALGFTALAVWTGGDATVAAAHRLLGLPDGDVMLAVGYALISAIIIAIAIYGYRWMVAAEALMIPVMGTVFLLGFIAFAPKFNADATSGTYVLGSFGPTWALSAVIAASTTVAYGPFVGDWTRYISPRRWSTRSAVLATGAGAFTGLGIAFLFGAFTASAFVDPALPYAQSLVADAPLWYVFGVIVLGLVAGAAQGATGLYGTGLDTSSLIPRLTRVQATCVIGVVAVALVYLGVFVWDAVDSISAFVTLLGIVGTPWVLILVIGYWWRRGRYDQAALQVFIRGERGGIYWFTRGINVRAFAAWIPAAVAGVLFSNTTIYTGPWSDAANGVDLSTPIAGVVGAALYVLLLVAFPEPAEVGGRISRPSSRDPEQTESPVVYERA
jgi:purine-cytosine permease-like protein